MATNAAVEQQFIIWSLFLNYPKDTYHTNNTFYISLQRQLLLTIQLIFVYVFLYTCQLFLVYFRFGSDTGPFLESNPFPFPSKGQTRTSILFGLAVRPIRNLLTRLIQRKYFCLRHLLYRPQCRAWGSFLREQSPVLSG